MVNANELRIGNWILNGNNYPIQVGYHEIRYAVIHPGTQNNYEGIPLTPEILEACGFKRTAGTSFIGGVECAGFDFCDTFFGELLQDCNNRNRFDLLFKYSCNESNEDQQLGSVEYLHQLQNLYLALTGSELTLKSLSPEKP